MVLKLNPACKGPVYDKPRVFLLNFSCNSTLLYVSGEDSRTVEYGLKRKAIVSWSFSHKPTLCFCNDRS